MDCCCINRKLRNVEFHGSVSAIGHDHNEIIESFLVSVILGAGNCSGAAILGADDAIKEILNWKKGMPSQSMLSSFF